MPNKYDNEIAGAMMEASGEMPPEGEEMPADAVEGEDTDLVASVADDLSALTGTEVTPEQVAQLVDAIVEQEASNSEEGSTEEKSALPEDFS